MKESASPKRVVAHIDMDCFFASCEEASNPYLKSYPVIICGRAKRGVVTTANRIAKVNYGIKVGMSGHEAKKLCPQGIHIIGDLDKYIFFSQRINEMIREFSPTVEPYSIDELFLDLTGCPGIEDLEALGLKIKARIAGQLKLPSTIGFGPNRFVAKMACRLGKPDGLMILNQKSYREFYWPRPLTDLWGIGERGARRLNHLGIKTVGDLAHFSKKKLIGEFGIHGQIYHQMAWGQDESPVGEYNDRPNLSYGHSYTLEKNSRNLKSLRAVLFRLCDRCTARMRRDGFCGKTIHMSFETQYGRWIGKQVSLKEPTQSDLKVFKTCLQIFRSQNFKTSVRRLAMRVSNLYPANREYQLSLFDCDEKLIEKKTLQSVDAIRNKFGDASLIRGCTLADFRSLKAIHFQTARRFQSQKSDNL